MNRHSPQGNAQVNLDREAEEITETGQEVLLEIAEDARRLKNRYPKETIVPEGGE
ncbi:MAG TPA: hypothetical protein VIG29_19450 [Vicinamibacteria bacterium]|jgi:hypothetical protein